MKKTKFLKKIMTLAGITCFGLTILFSPTATLVAEASTEATVAPCADSIEWRVKIENGKLYRRLYNYSTDEWIGEWEYVCDVDE